MTDRKGVSRRSLAQLCTATVLITFHALGSWHLCEISLILHHSHSDFSLDLTRLSYVRVLFSYVIKCCLNRYNKPLQASVRAVTDGSLWALKREDFRGVLLTGFSNPSILNIIRSIDVLAKLTLIQLNRLAGSLSEVSFMDGERIVDKVSGRYNDFLVEICFLILSKV
jgi:CRP-like cAMP-binding protein